MTVHSRPPHIKKHARRVKNTLLWIVSGDFGKLAQAIKDQFWIKSTFIRRFYRNHFFVEQRKRILIKRLLSNTFGAESKGRIRVAIIADEALTHPKSSVFIRLIAPLSHHSLRKTISWKLYGNDTTKLDDDTDICIVQRTAYSNETKAQELIDYLTTKQIKLVIDNDDAFHSIDKSHPEHNSQSSKTAALNLLVDHASQIWLSTDYLANSYKNTPAQKIIIPNALDSRIWKRNGSTPLRRNVGLLRMIYMGTVTHDADLAMILPALKKIAHDYPGSFELTVIGVSASLPEEPWIKRLYQPRDGSIYPIFVRWFLKQKPYDIGLSPLIDSAFNQGKSDIKCLDYLAAGILPIVSDILPYQSRDIENFIVKVKNSPDDWRESIEKLVADIAKTRKLAKDRVERGQKYLWDKRSTMTTARQLKKLLEELLVTKLS